MFNYSMFESMRRDEMNIMKSLRKLLWVFCLLLCSCGSNTSSMLNISRSVLPNGIYYDGRIYWEDEDGKKKNVQGDSLGALQEVAKVKCFPVSDLVGTNALEKYIGSEIYAYDNNLYLQNKENVFVFQYITQSNEKREEIVSEETYQGTEYAIPPHFIYKDLLYSTYQGEDLALPSGFEKVGKIEKSYVRANTNYTGNIPIHSELYATKFQNRFMIVKNSEDKKYYVFENEVYHSIASKNP